VRRGAVPFVARGQRWYQRRVLHRLGDPTDGLLTQALARFARAILSHLHAAETNGCPQIEQKSSVRVGCGAW